MENFDHFRQIWLGSENKLYTRIYKKLSWIFFSEYSVPYLHSSRIKKVKTRHSHLKHIYRFLEGIQKPETFNYFKKLLRWLYILKFTNLLKSKSRAYSLFYKQRRQFKVEILFPRFTHLLQFNAMPF